MVLSAFALVQQPHAIQRDQQRRAGIGWHHERQL